MPTLADRLALVPPSATVGIADAAARLRLQGVDVLDLSAGRAAENTPAYIVDAAINALRDGQTHQTMAIGTPGFRAACAAKLRRENALEADPDSEVIATMGVKQGLTLALLATVNPGDEVIVEDPCFVSYQPLIRLAGGVPVAVPLRTANAFHWTREDLEPRITPRTRAVLFNSPHNPTGAVAREADLDLIAGLARRHDLVVLADEVYERVTWNRRTHLSIASRPDMRDRTITLMGLTKTFSMGGWRVGFVHATGERARAMATLQAHLITCANSFVQAGAAVAFGEPPAPEVRVMWAEWERRCVFVARRLDAMPGVRCLDPEGGFYAWADISGTGWTDTDLADALLEREHVAVVPGSAFGPSGAGFIRVTCVRAWPVIEEALTRIRRLATSPPPPGSRAVAGAPVGAKGSVA
jgi:aspartate/methionine/tyrosine aminotransferase